jgi:hypothetical protein
MPFAQVPALSDIWLTIHIPDHCQLGQMGLWVLEDTHLGDVPGTATLIETFSEEQKTGASVSRILKMGFTDLESQAWFRKR